MGCFRGPGATSPLRSMPWLGLAIMGTAALLLGSTLPMPATNAGEGGKLSLLPFALAGTPSSPQFVKAAPHNASVNVTWSPPAYAGSGPVLSYTVDVWNGSILLGTRNVLAPANHTYIKYLQNGVTYSFAVAASNYIGQGNFSATVTAMPGTVPETMAAPVVIAGNQSAHVTWTLIASPIGYPILSYMIRLDGNGNVSTFSFAVNVSAYNISGLTNGVSYLVSVRAIDALGPGVLSPSSDFVPAGLPSVPTGLTAQWYASAQRFVVSWGLPGYLGGVPVANFTLTWTTPDQRVMVARLGPQVFNYALPAAPAGFVFHVTLHATNRAGDGPNATVVAVVPPPSPVANAFLAFWSTPLGAVILLVGVAVAITALAARWRRARWDIG